VGGFVGGVWVVCGWCVGMVGVVGVVGGGAVGVGVLVLVCWRVGVLACWRVGVLACWWIGINPSDGNNEDQFELVICLSCYLFPLHVSLLLTTQL
jgi:hypothetical protein